MLWAQNLKAEEISKIEARVFPPQGEYSYRLYAQDCQANITISDVGLFRVLYDRIPSV